MALTLNGLAAAAASVAQQAVPVIAGNRVLMVDGDALCYYCAGNDDTTIGQARINVAGFIKQAMDRSGAKSAVILVTGDGSNKGHRYSVARVKPYQGHRSGKSRPKNWEALRGLIQSGSFNSTSPQITTNVTTYCEADDLFSYLSHEAPDEYVIFTQDKDMRMVPGWHLTWPDMMLFYVPPGTYSMTMHDKLYGLRWFWTQMLMGDTADNIPGLPGYYDGIVKSGPNKGQPKLVKVGEVGASDILAGSTKDSAYAVVCSFYENYYGSNASLQMLEQGILLWMRKNPGDVFDVAVNGNPLFPLSLSEEWQELKDKINERILRASSPQDDGSEDSAGADALAAGLPVRDLQATSDSSGSSSGSRSLDGGSTSSAASGVQRPPWED